MRCQWAGCKLDGNRPVDGWAFCPRHLPEHLQMRDEGDIAGSAIPRVERVSPRPRVERYEQIRVRLEIGETVREISAELGLTERHIRQIMREGQMATPPKRAECGTRSGYVRHRRYCEPVCGPCKTAQSTYDRARHQARRAA